MFASWRLRCLAGGGGGGRAVPQAREHRAGFATQRRDLPADRGPHARDRRPFRQGHFRLEPPVGAGDGAAQHEHQQRARDGSRQLAPRAPRRRRKLPRAVTRTLLVLVLGGAVAGAYWWFQPEVPLPKWSTITGVGSAIGGKVSALGSKAGAMFASLRHRATAPAPTRQAAKPPAREHRARL